MTRGTTNRRWKPFEPDLPPAWSLVTEARLDQGPGGYDTRGRGERSVLRVNLSRLLLGLLNVARRIRYLRIRRVPYRMPLHVRKLLQGIANHGISHVACLAQTLKLVIVSGNVEAEKIGG